MTGRWDSKSLQGLARAFRESRVFLTAVELDIFTRLDDEWKTATELAADTGCDEENLEVLLNALAAMELLQKSGDSFRASPEVARFMSAGSENSILPLARHSANLWYSWTELTEIVCTGERSSKMATERGGESLEDFIGAMHCHGEEAAEQIVAAIDVSAARKLIDIGGGSGTYTIAFLKANLDLKATIFDLPAVIEMARRRLRDVGLEDRVDLIGGDFYIDALPAGHDLAFLSAIIHQNSLEQNKELYGKVFNALNPGGEILIRDYIMDESKTKPCAGALFAINMLVGTPGGGTYTFNDIKEGLGSAGFVDIKLVQPGKLMDGLVMGRKPV
jgi:predicted O-methyltransferase YrrM